MTRRTTLAAVSVLALILYGCGGRDTPRDDGPAQRGANGTDDGAKPNDAGGPITKRRLGPGVNTPYAELLPIADASGDRLYFTRANYPDPTMRAFMEKMMNDQLAKCRSVDSSAVEEAAKKAGAELSEADKQTLANLAAGCDTIAETRDRDLYNYDRSEHPNQVYVSERQADGTWNEAKRLPAPLNDETFTNIGSVSITSASPDRRTLLLMGDFLFGRQRTDGCVDLGTMLGIGQVQCLGVAIARNTGTAWVREDRLRTDPFDERLALSGAALAPDGRTVIFSARDANTRTDNHNRLFVTRWNETSGRWSAPREIDALKGAFETVTPFIGPDGRSLYFASDRPGGQGALDLYMTRRQSEDWLEWTEPENLGPGVNSEQNDVSISVDATGRYAFMASGDGAQLDIYEFNLPPNLSPAPTAIVGGRILLGGPLAGEPSGGPGQPMDGEPFLPRGGGGGGGGNLDGTAGGGDQVQRDGQTVVFVRMSDGSVAGQASLGFSGPTASFETRLPVGDEYAAYVSVPGFAGIGQVVDLTNTRQDQRVEQDLAVARLAPGAVIRLNNVFFETDSAELLPTSRAELDRLVLTLGRYPTMRIEVAGHTDSRSSDEYNESLSDRRAASVRTYLEGEGIDPRRLQSHGYGERQPIASNDTEEGQALNRRVEFRILEM
jgi:OOP family OmpA-OmpF porin